MKQERLRELRTHIDLALFSLVFHIDADDVPEKFRDMLSGSNDLLSFDEVIDTLFADERFRTLLFHETYHFWQALRLPYLYFYGLKWFQGSTAALPQMLPITAISDVRNAFDIGAVPEFQQISHKRQIKLQDRVLTDPRDPQSAVDLRVSAELSAIDLMEGAATFCQWQVQQEISSRLDIKAFRRWCKRNPSYTTAFRFADDWIQDDTLLMRSFVPLVCGAFHTSDPPRAFAELLFVLQRWSSDPNFVTTMSYPDPRPWSHMIVPFLDALKFDAPPNSITSLYDPKYCRLTMDFWLYDTTYRHPVLSKFALEWNEAIKAAEKPDWFNQEAELVYQPAWMDQSVFINNLIHRGPPIIFFVLHQPTGARRVIPYVDFEALTNVANARELLYLCGMHGAIRKLSGMSFDPLHRFCYHTGCPEYEPNFCNLYFAVPKDHVDCQFPQLMRDFGRANNIINPDVKNDDPDQTNSR